MSNVIPFPRAGWLGSRIATWTRRKRAEFFGKRPPSPKAMQALRDKFAKDPKKAA